MNNLDKQYTDLLQDILDNGTKKETRNGGTISVFGRQIRHKMSDGFPLLTTKKMPFKTIVTELLWFLRGDTNIKYLLDNNCHIWDGDAYKRYLNTYKGNFELDKEEFINAIKTSPDFAKQWGELGPIYGKQWRNWSIPKIDSISLETVIDTLIEVGNGITDEYLHEEASRLIKERDKNQPIDQIANSINLLKTDPDSRRNRVNAWNVGELDQMVLPPCHTDFQFFTRELSFEERCKIQIDRLDGMYSPEKDIFIKSSIDEVKLMTMDKNNIPTRAISLMWNQRSVDTFLGLPFNIASYGLLLEIIAKEVNMVPDELIGNLGDTHLYLNHIEQAKEQIGREYTHEEMVEIYYRLENKKDREGWWTWETRFEDNNISKRTREPFELPILKIQSGIGLYDFFEYLHVSEPSDFVIENYQSHPTIKAPLSN
jgi:thymidylate synthase